MICLPKELVDAAKETNLSVPLVVSLAGTNVELGKEILKILFKNYSLQDNLADAAKKIVELAK